MSNMTNKHEKHLSTAANHGDFENEQDDQINRRDSIVSDAGLWSIHSVDGGSDRDELEDITSEFHDSPAIKPLKLSIKYESPESATESPFKYSAIVYPSPTLTPSPTLSPSSTPLCDNLLEWFDKQMQKFGFADMMMYSRSTSIKILPSEDDWSQMVKLSAREKIAYLLRRFCPESSRASWFVSREKLFFARLAPQEMIRYLYLGPIDRGTLLGAYFKTLGFNEGWLVSEERKKALVRFVFEGETVNLT
jgi:hypothetical protein